MNRKKAGKRGIFVILLLCLAAGSAAVLGTILESRTNPEKNVIFLTEMQASNQNASSVKSGSVKSDQVNPVIQGIDAVDYWDNQTTISLFEDTYLNADGSITVKSANEEHVIAPGTENDYTFQLKNTGNVSLDYTMRIDHNWGESQQEIPIEVRLRKGSGEYVLGSSQGWILPEELNQVKETGTLAVNHYAQYTLEWRWMYETENESQIEEGDAVDIALGNQAEEEKVDLSITIYTEAVETPGSEVVPTETQTNNGSGNGTDSPQAAPGNSSQSASGPKTGDSTKFALYTLLIIAAVIVVLMLAVIRRYREEIPDERQSKSGKKQR